MSESSRRIEQFRQMAGADPNNELGHFSLGRAYLDDGQPSEAIAPLQRALELNANLGRAYELLAQAYTQSRRTREAIETLTRGVGVAHERGERLSRDAMIEALKKFGAPVPALSAATPSTATLAGNQVLCVRCGKASSRLPRPPFRNPQGALIQEKVCQDCWRQWLAMGTKVINELRLPMNEPEGQKVFERHMLEFLNLMPST